MFILLLVPCLEIYNNAKSSTKYICAVSSYTYQPRLVTSDWKIEPLSLFQTSYSLNLVYNSYNPTIQLNA
jgi:hypothetical protein